MLSSFFAAVTSAVETVILPASVLCTGGYFLLKGNGFLLTLPFRHPLRLWRGLFPKRSPDEKKDSVSPLKAMLLALAGTLGIGNLSGVASAVVIGGAGALFWMLLSSVAAMALKYAEILLAMKHRKKEGDRYHGGPGVLLSRRGRKCFAVLTLFCSFAIGNSMQGAAAAATAAEVFPGDSLLPAVVVGGLLSLLLLITLLRAGGRKLFDLTVYLVPIMTVLYVLLSAGVLWTMRSSLPSVFAQILTEAFTPQAVSGGALGSAILQSIRCGVLRGLISNEAGCGTAPMAHCEAENGSGAVQGWFGILEVFADTAILCTLTGVVVLVCGAGQGASPDSDGMTLLLTAFRSVYGNSAGGFLLIAVFLFAFATTVSWSYYGCECLYLLGLERYQRVYLVVYALSAFGLALLPSGIIWSAAELAVSLLTIGNCALLLQKQNRQEIVRETRLFSHLISGR